MEPHKPPAELWTDERLVVRNSGIQGRGLFADRTISTGTVVIRLSGRLVTTAELETLIATATADPDAACVDTLTVHEDAHLVLAPGTLVHFGNHSCDPNLWHVGPYELATRRDVAAGEELTVDYATNSGGEGLSLNCRCGSTRCRGVITSGDWRRPELQNRYRGHWTPALRQRIDDAG